MNPVSLRDDLRAFCYLVLPHLFPADPSPLHNTLAGIATLEPEPDQNIKIAIMAFRGSGKSTWLSVAYVLWAVAFQKAKNILLVSETEDVAREWLSAIKEEIENNPILHALFGELRGPRWRETFCRFSNGVRIRAIGARGQIRGRRPDLILCDDIENREMCAKSQDNRSALKAWFWDTLYPALAKGGKILVLGTPVHQDSLLQQLVIGPTGLGQPGWIVRKFPASTERGARGTALWPDYFSVDRLTEIKRDLDTSPEPGAYSREYDCEPIAETDLIFPPRQFVKCAPLTPDLTSSMWKVLSLDPAIGETTRADDASICILGIHKDGPNKGKAQVLECLYGKWGMDSMLEHAHNLYLKWNIDVWAYEGILWQKLVRPAILRECRETWHHPVRLFEMPSTTDKIARAISVSYLLEQGLVLWPHEPLAANKWGAPRFPIPWNQITTFPEVDADDHVDAFTQALRAWELFWRTRAAKAPKLAGKALGPIGDWQHFVREQAKNRAKNLRLAQKRRYSGVTSADTTGLF